MKPLQEDSNRNIREQAAWWLAELQEETPNGEAQFAAWLRESPRHVEEFLLFNALWRELDRLDPQRQMDIDRIIAESMAARTASKVVPLQTTGQHSQQAREVMGLRWKLVAGVAVLVCGAVLAWPWATPYFAAAFPGLVTGTRSYVTAVGEQRAIKLKDESVVYLNTHSRLEVSYSARARDVRLLEGEALFSVERDPARPFRVRAGGAIVQAVGTRFNVYRRAEGTTVSVIEGVVQISKDTATAVAQPAAALPARLAAGQQAEILNRGNTVKHTASDIDQAVAWRERRLVFRSDPLEEVAAEFNRYNTLQIRVEGDTLRAKRLIGTFDADDPESLLQFLATENAVVVERSAETLVIRARSRR